jgi:polyphosphate glucokinase
VSDGPRTLSVDCGGTGMKSAVLDASGSPVSTRVRVRTPYPCPPAVFVDTIERLASGAGVDFDRVSVGMPGLVRHGVVRWTPHYVTESGPFSPIRSDLALLWQDLEISALLESALDRPTRVVNDAELAGLSVISGRGYEVMLTLGTGLGFAHFTDGALLPKIEVSAAPFRKGSTFDERLGHHARKAHGSKTWSREVHRALRRLYAVFSWDRAYLGGGGSKHLRVRVDEYVTLVGNHAGLLGGVRLWDEANALGVIDPRPATDG